MRKDAIEGTSGSVSSEEELRAALARGLTPITLTGCFSINGADSLVVDYNAEIIGGGHILTQMCIRDSPVILRLDRFIIADGNGLSRTKIDTAVAKHAAGLRNGPPPYQQ